MLELKEIDTARAVLRDSEAMKTLKESNLERYLKLENLLSQVVLSGDFPTHLTESKRSKREHLFSGNICVTLVLPVLSYFFF